MPKIRPRQNNVPHKNTLVSACLAGVNCTFRATNNLNDKVKTLLDRQLALALCPEVTGGLGVPRENIELLGGDGFDVLDGKARAMSSNGKDVTQNVIKGAASILEIVKKCGINQAILKSNSPACGVGVIYDGTFSKTLKAGDGVMAALLKRNKIPVMTENEITQDFREV